MSRNTKTADPRSLLYIVVIAIELNVGIHAALMPMHLDEMFYIGVLFAIGDAALVASLLLLFSQRLRTWGWALGAATGAVEAIAYAASRTLGLPGGYHERWTAQPEDVLGLICLATDVVLITAGAVQLRRRYVPGDAHLLSVGRSSRPPSPQRGPLRRLPTSAGRASL